jgi:uncharacterized protein YegP (UPF0339 family)
MIQIVEVTNMGSTFFPLDNLIFILILFFIGLSMILYIFIKYITERKKDEQPLEDISRGKFEVYKDKAGKYRFRLKAGNGEIIAIASQGYITKNSCIKGIKSVKKNSPKALIIELDD